MKRLLSLVLCLVLLTACSPAAAPTQSPTAVPPASETPVPPTATITPTLPPTETPLPTATFTPSPTPVPQTISSANTAALTLARRYGAGRLEQLLWSPDGKSLLVLTSLQLSLYDPFAGKPVWQVKTGTAQRRAAFSPDGKTLTLVSAGGAVQLRDAATGEVKSGPVPQQKNIIFQAVSADGQFTALTNIKRETSVWDIAAGKEIQNNQARGMLPEASDVLIAPDGSFFVTGAYSWTGPQQQVQVWDTKTGNFLRGMIGIGNAFITELQLSPDGKMVAGVSRLRLTKLPTFDLLVWNTDNGSLVKKITRSMDIVAYTFTSASSVVLAMDDGSMEEYSLPDGEKKAFYAGHNASVLMLAASPDSKQIATADVEGYIKIWDTGTHKETKQFQIELSQKALPWVLLGTNYLTRGDRTSGLVIDPKGKYVGIPSPDLQSVTLIDPYTLKVLRTVGDTFGEIFPIAVSPDGQYIGAMDLSAGMVIYVFDAKNGRTLKTIQTDHKWLTQQMMFSPDSKTVFSLSGGTFGELYGWDIATGKKVMTLSGSSSMAASPDGKLYVSDNVDFGLYFWEAATGKRLQAASADWIYSIDYAPDGKTVAIGGYEIHKDVKEHVNMVSFMDAEKYKTTDQVLEGDPCPIEQVRYAPDGKLLATADHYGNVMLWDLSTGKLVKQIDEAAPAPVYMDFLPDGRTLVLAGGDGTVSFFEVK